jgi:CxxC motif-containing protein (DUF1111 family)
VVTVAGCAAYQDIVSFLLPAPAELPDGLFEQPVVPLQGDAPARFLAGYEAFHEARAAASGPGSAPEDGRGHQADARACAACHVNNGRGRPPQEAGERPDTMILRISQGAREAGAAPGTATGAAPLPHPRYGRQFDYHPGPDARVEGRVTVTYRELRGRFPDGEDYALRLPSYGFSELAFGPLGEDTLVSPRIAPPVIGLGLIAGLDEKAILARADPDDADGDGVSGRANYVTDPLDGGVRLGRFGWKAGAASLGRRSTTSEVTGTDSCADTAAACDARAHGSGSAPGSAGSQGLAYYLQLLGAPARRDVEDPQVIRGEALFAAAGCGGCHLPRMVSGVHPDQPLLSRMVFHPYSDFLLHDMGKGLADGRPDFEASGREWRTPPLWGLGLTEAVGGAAFFLHDGRARGLMEAILWHGGEATPARKKVRAMDEAERTALIAFLNSL